MTIDDGLGFSDEQLAEIRKFLAKKVEEEKAKRAARDIAGSITKADLAFGKRLQEELYRPRPTNERFGQLLQQQIWAGAMPVSPPTKSTPRVKRKPLWKRLAARLSKNRRSKEAKTSDNQS